VQAVDFFWFGRFKNFNLLFDELYQRQTQWTIPDNELREAVRLAVAEVLLPAYRSFIKRYRYLSLFFFLNAFLGLSNLFFPHGSTFYAP
jgi:hypothetical protein